MIAGSLFRAFGPQLASAVGVRIVASALNHLLGQHPNARRRLAAHQSKVIRVGLDTQLPGVVKNVLTPPELWFEIAVDGSLNQTEAGDAAATLLVKPSLQAMQDVAASGSSQLARHLRVEGDILLAGLLAELVQDLRWDFEDDLSRLVGDIPARRAGRFVEQVGEIGQAMGRRAAAAVAGEPSDTPSHGSSTEGSGGTADQQSQQPPLLSRSVFEQWRDQTTDLHARVQAIETRLQSNQNPNDR